MDQALTYITVFDLFYKPINQSTSKLIFEPRSHLFRETTLIDGAPCTR